MLRAFALLLGSFLWSGIPAMGGTYYVAPLGTKVSGTPDGSMARPFLSVNAAFSSGKVSGGDVLLLGDGNYGELSTKMIASFDEPVIVMSQNGKGAHFDNILLGHGTHNLVLRNLSVWPSAAGKQEISHLVRAYKATSNITLDGLDIRGEENAGNYMEWDADKWNKYKYSAVLLQGPGSIVANSRMTGVYGGIMVEDNSQIINNVIDGYNGDGMRAFSNSVVRGNLVINAFSTDDNHADGFQSYSIGREGGVVTGLIVDGNTIIEWTGQSDHPLRATLQGIGLFDGMYKDLTITNNVVSVTHWHGISVYGAQGAKITNNIVVNGKGLPSKVPHIAVRSHKDGRPSTDVLVADNLAMSFDVANNVGNRIQVRGNSVIGYPERVFENPSAFDYRLKGSEFPDKTEVIPTLPPQDDLWKEGHDETFVPEDKQAGVAPPKGDTAVAPVPLPGAGLLLFGALSGLAVLRGSRSA